MHVSAFASKLLSQGNTTFVHEIRVPSGSRGQTGWEDTDAIRASKPGWTICITDASEVESWDTSDLSDAGRSRLPVSTGHDPDLLVYGKLGDKVLGFLSGCFPC